MSVNGLSKLDHSDQSQTALLEGCPLPSNLQEIVVSYLPYKHERDKETAHEITITDLCKQTGTLSQKHEQNIELLRLKSVLPSQRTVIHAKPYSDDELHARLAKLSDNLKYLTISWCNNLHHVNLNLPQVRHLYISGDKIETIDLRNCSDLKEVYARSKNAGGCQVNLRGLKDCLVQTSDLDSPIKVLTTDVQGKEITVEVGDVPYTTI